MTHRSNVLGVAIALAAAVSLLAQPAGAFVPDKAEQKCRGTIAKGVGGIIKTANKTIAGCHKGNNSGKTSVADCNDAVAADTKGKIAKSQSKLTDGIAKSCTGLDGDILEDFLNCPEPCATSTGLGTGLLDNYTDLGTCLACAAVELSNLVNDAVLGDPADISGDKAAQKCHGAIAKGYGKLFDTIVKDRNGCQKGVDKGGDSSTDTCVDADVKGKIAKAVAKAQGGIDKSCTGDLSDLGTCATDTPANLKACADAAYSAAGRSGFLMSYESAPTVCPSKLTQLVVGGQSNLAIASCTGGTCVGGPDDGSSCSTDKDCQDTRTVLNVGWGGVGHDIDIPDGYIINTTITCPGTAGACGVCTVDGIDPAGSQYSFFARCQEDLRIECSNPFGTDPACPGAQRCDYHAGGLLANVSGGTPTCTRNRFASDVTGTLEFETGEGDVTLDLRATVFTGLGKDAPCPLCVNDTTPQDGQRDGTCLGGPDDGESCDVHSFDETFGATSLDCGLSTGSNISGTGLVVDLGLTTGTATMTFDNDCDSGASGNDCACGMCSHDSTQVCQNDADCDALSSGSTCTAKGSSGADRKPNACNTHMAVDFQCNDDAGLEERGSCSGSGPFDSYCDGFTRANGTGFITCGSDTDCDNFAAASDLVDDAGNCSLVQVRSCFKNPISISGAPTPVDTTQKIEDQSTLLAGTFCLAPTINSGLNGTVGSPGPAALKIDSFLSVEY